MCKLLSLTLNAFVPNLWEYVVTPSLYDPLIYFPMKPKFDNPADAKAAQDYCHDFVEKVCMGTELKLMNYLSFHEFVVFLSSPSDAQDALTVAANLSPYTKLTDPNPLRENKELFEDQLHPTDGLLYGVNAELLKRRIGCTVKPRDLTSKAVGANSKDAFSGLSLLDVATFMQKLEFALFAEVEKLDLLLDLAGNGWTAFEALKPGLQKLGYLLSDLSTSVYKSFALIAEHRDRPTFAEGISGLLTAAGHRRDLRCFQNIFLLAYNLATPEDIKTFANFSFDLAQAIKLSRYNKALM